MKIRTGFVSNSSSSSFCIIGTRSRVPELVEKAGAKEEDFGHGVCKTKLLSFHGSGELTETIAGLPADELLQRMSIPGAKRHFVKYIKKHFGIELDISEVEFEFGEAGTE